MSEIKQRVKHTLDEGRMLVLGVAVLIGFQFRMVLETGFDRLPRSTQFLHLGGLALLLLGFALILAAGSYHRIVAAGQSTEDTRRFGTIVVGWALLPFALGLGITLFIATEKTVGRGAGIVAGLAAALVALAFWYGIELMQAGRSGRRSNEDRTMDDNQENDGGGGTELKDKIEHVLGEGRTTLPGVQALLGFQFATMLTEGFDKLPTASKYVHLASLGLIALTVVFLLAPAAYHRIVEGGEETEGMHRFASAMLLAGMITLALGISGDVYVVVRKVTHSSPAGIAAAALAVALMYALWFGYTLYRRGQQSPGLQPTAGERHALR